MPKPDKKRKPPFSVGTDFVLLLAGISSIAISAYGAVMTFISSVDGVYWLIPLGFIVWLAVLWRLFQSRIKFAYILLAVMLVGLLSGLFFWRQDQLRAGKFIILVTQFDMQGVQPGFRDQLIQQIKEATSSFGNTEIISTNEAVSSADWIQSAAQIGEKENADLLVWGFYRQEVNPNVSIRIMDFSPMAPTTVVKGEIYSNQETISTFDSIVITRNIQSKTNTVGLFLAGILSLKQGDYELSLQLFEKVVSQNDPTISIPPYDLIFYTAYAQAGLKQYDLAIATYNNAILKYRKGAESYNNRGVIYADLGQDDLAVQNYTTAIQVNKDYSAAYNNRGNAYVRMNQFENAMLDFSKAVGIDPNYANGFYNRGNAFYDLAQYDLAIKDYSQAILLEPDSYPAYFNRGTAYLKLGKTAESEADLKKYSQLLTNLP